MTEAATRRCIVSGQPVDQIKVQRSRQLRREMTESERILWEAVRDRRLNGLRFRRQQAIDGFIAEFFCSSAGLVVEVDGASHAQQAEYDEARDEALPARSLECSGSRKTRRGATSRPS